MRSYYGQAANVYLSRLGLALYFLLTLIFSLLFRRRSTGLQHLFHQVEFHPGFRFILSQWKIVDKVKMAHVGCIGVSMLICHPLILWGIRVTRANVFWLEMLELTVNVVSFSHFFILRCCLKEYNKIPVFNWLAFQYNKQAICFMTHYYLYLPFF